jgi:iron complex transport system substrate-binding protein
MRLSCVRCCSGRGLARVAGVRVVSLLPAATEIVYALGVDRHLVGVSFECDEPPAARVDKAVVVRGRDTGGMSPRQIDDYVRAEVAAGRDLYTLDAGALKDLAPEVILTQDLCRVCALPAGQVEQALEYLGCRAEVVRVDPHSLAEVLESIRTIGVHTGAAERAEELVAGLRRRLEAVAAAVVGRPRPRVAVVEWVDPPFTAGHWVPDLVSAAGAEPVAAHPGGRSAQTTWADIAAARPDLVLLAPCGYGLAAATTQARAVADALPGRPVWALDANSIIVRPGPRLVTGVETIAAIAHPDTVTTTLTGHATRIA